MKVARTVLTRGKEGDNVKLLPIRMKNMTFFYDSIVKPFMEEAQLNFLCKGS